MCILPCARVNRDKRENIDVSDDISKDITKHSFYFKCCIVNAKKTNTHNNNNTKGILFKICFIRKAKNFDA